MTRADLVRRARDLYEDLDLASVRRWIAEEPGRKAIGYLPVYAPREVVLATHGG